jgi:NitT/TauT family transport system permease protein
MTRLINRAPRRSMALLLGAAPFAAAILAYAYAAAIRHAANPADKLLPGATALVNAAIRMAATPDPRTGGLLLWTDTAASLQRLFLGLGAATAIGLCAGVAIGLLPLARAGLAPIVAVLSMVPPMAILPIVFISFGLGEASKIVLICLGVTPFLIRDLALSVESIPAELLIKAQTLGASTWQIALRVVLPLTWPRLIDALRLSLGPAFLCVISAEAIASEGGLGFRIFLMRRYLAMDVILLYVAWITLLAWLADLGLRTASRALFPWAGKAE